MLRSMESASWDQWLTSVDELVKKGKKAEVLFQINQRLEKKLNDELKPKVARLANRAGFTQLALKILYKQVRDNKVGIKKISTEAISVYAQSLLNIGALDESESLLNAVSDRPEIELQKAFICFARWDYQKSIPHLKKYIRQGELTDYQKLVGRVNYVAALVSIGHFANALRELTQVEKQLKILKADLLLGNINELKAQIFIYQKKYSQAQVAIKVSSEYLKAFPGRYALYTRKWNAVIDFNLQENSEQLTEQLESIRREGLTAHDWETVRDCDFQLAFLLKNRLLLDKIYLGSPHPGFRKRLRDLYKLKPPQSKRVHYSTGPLNETSSEVGLDFSDYSSVSTLSRHELTLLQTILKDIYKPPRIGEVFAMLYPNEYFDPFSSVQRVKNVIHRTNKTLNQIRSGLQIKVANGYFQLQSSKLKEVVFSQPQLFWSYEKFQLGLIHGRVKNHSFTIADLDLVFNNRHDLHKLIKWALKNRKIVKVNQTKPHRYRFSRISKTVPRV